MEVGDRIKRFITSEIMFEDAGTELRDDTILLSGVMDSLGLLQLVEFLEQEFDVVIGDAEMTADHFRTVADVERMVREKVKT